MKRLPLLLLAVIAAFGAALLLLPTTPSRAADLPKAQTTPTPPPAPDTTKIESLVLGGGCFWCLDAAYKLIPGVKHVTCGYAGGTTANPTYAQVCTDTTGHAEVVKIDYDPAKTTPGKLLQYFWEIHDPTQVGGQGADRGPSYRSIILYADDTQKMAAEQSRAAEQKNLPKPITTEIVPLVKFWPAEAEHQDYFEKHPDSAYCSIVIAPKVSKLKNLLNLPGPK